MLPGWNRILMNVVRSTKVISSSKPRHQLMSVSLAGYGQANKYYWVRGGIKQQFSNYAQQGDTTFHAGIEMTKQGNNDLNSSQIGGVFEMAYPRSRASLQFRYGYSQSEYADGTRNSGAYFGVGSYWAY